jgi:hypothetical protein
MYFNIKNYLKSNHNYITKHSSQIQFETCYIASNCNPSETQIQIKLTRFSSFPLRALSWTTSKSRLVHNNRQVHKEVFGTKKPQTHYKH